MVGESLCGLPTRRPRRIASTNFLEDISWKIIHNPSQPPFKKGRRNNSPFSKACASAGRGEGGGLSILVVFKRRKTCLGSWLLWLSDVPDARFANWSVPFTVSE
jgi:hypothetical protein